MRQGVSGAIFVVLASLLPADLYAQQTDPAPAWPLCGRISESPPPGWVESEGCPANRFGDPAHTDAPFSSTFGPRPLGSENDRYDFHRGIDIATPTGTPIFAVADGRVDIAGNHSSYSDPLIKLRHYRPGATTCSNGDGCYFSFYLHISDWVVGEDQEVGKGELIGYTGASGASGFQHLHFEVRDAPAFDVHSAWQRDSIHPLGVLPYDVPNDTIVTINAVNAADPDATTADVTVTSNRYDLVSVEVTVKDEALNVIDQPGNTPVNGYHVLPAFFDMETWNFEYTHKDSNNFPWEDFGAGGPLECPYHDEHGANYDAGVHMDRQDPADAMQGLFNGVHIETGKYWLTGEGDYQVNLEFRALKGPAACIEASAVFASGDVTTAGWGECEPAPAYECSASKSVPADEWVMFSLPCSPTANTVADVFPALDIGTYGTEWIVYYYDNDPQGGNPGYVALAPDSPLLEARGYFVYTFTPTTVTVEGPSNTGADIELRTDASNGAYNLVGHPYGGETPWPEALVVDGATAFSLADADPAVGDGTHECDLQPPGPGCLVSRKMHKWHQTAYQVFDGLAPTEGVLAPFDAVWVKAFEPGVMLRVPPPVEEAAIAAVQSDSSNKAREHSPASTQGAVDFPAEWYVQLIVESGQFSDPGNYLGRLNGARNGLDARDLEEPAPFGSRYLSILFTNPRFPTVEWGYTTDFRKPGKVPHGVWPFVVRASADFAQATLRWIGNTNILEGAVLIDENSGERVEVSEGGMYRFDLPAGERHFRIVMTPRAGAK